MAQLIALDPVPTISLGEICLLVPEAGRSPKGLTLNLRTENGRILDQRVLAVADVNAREAAVKALAAISGQGAEDLEQALLNLGSAVEVQMRNKSNRASAPSAGADRYVVADGRICYLDNFDGEQRPRPLCNFAAHIVEETALDDGEETRRQYVIEAQLATGETRLRCRVDAQAFGSMNWVADLGVQAIVHAGQANRDKLREAIQQLSLGAVANRHVYKHTGWREIDGRRVFLTAGGALGAPDIQVELEGPLAGYKLPAQVPEVPACQQGMAASLRMLDVAPRRITIPLLAAMFGAPLMRQLSMDFTIWPYGQSGAMKTTLSGLALSHYGDFVKPKNMPANWESTENALERLAFLAKDVPLIIDDFAPQATGLDAAQLERKACRLLRGQANRSGRGRMRSDTSLRDTYSPRGLLIVTGEQLPNNVESIVARMLAIEFRRGDVHDLDKLTAAQNEAHLYRLSMAGYLSWIGGQWDELDRTLPQAWEEIRCAMQQSEHHLRMPEMFATLYLAFDLMLRYATDLGVITDGQATELRDEAEDALATLTEAQGKRIQNANPSERFLTIIQTLIAQGKFYIEPDSGPDNWHGQGELLGCSDADYVYLMSDAAYRAVAQFCRDQGDHFPVKPETLHRDLVNKRIMVPPPQKEGANDPRLTFQKKHHGAKFWSMRLDRRLAGL